MFHGSHFESGAFPGPEISFPGQSTFSAFALDSPLQQRNLKSTVSEYPRLEQLFPPTMTP